MYLIIIKNVQMIKLSYVTHYFFYIYARCALGSWPTKQWSRHTKFLS